MKNFDFITVMSGKLTGGVQCRIKIRAAIATRDLTDKLQVKPAEPGALVVSSSDLGLLFTIREQWINWSSSLVSKQLGFSTTVTLCEFEVDFEVALSSFLLKINY